VTRANPLVEIGRSRKDGATAMGNVIRQEVVLEANPKRIYETLLDAKRFSEFTGGAPAAIASEAGGAFSSFNGMITGRNVELIPNQRIVQACAPEIGRRGSIQSFGSSSTRRGPTPS
jgi:hypothetical protein